MREIKLNIESIRSSLNQLGINQTELAKNIDVSKEAVSQWLKGEKVPRPAKLLQLSKLLGLNYNDLVLREKSNAPIVAYRTNKNKKLTEEQQLRAQDMGEMLQVLLPYLNSEVFKLINEKRIDSPIQ
jgi:transcriptional regulator with XRE-family HTH domain